MTPWSFQVVTSTAPRFPFSSTRRPGRYDQSGLVGLRGQRPDELRVRDERGDVRPLPLRL
ncbi:hypothetical protein ABZ642_45010 [Streptomyces sp. NPDC007157]|uniref:hypothetical protein n=1 Tax=Streptomyces sp. NPDC007157 TaxID=3154681 RepID=UPI0033D0EBCA